MITNGRVRRDQGARASEKVGEIERASGLFQLLISLGGTGQLALQACGEIGIRITTEFLKVGEQRVSRGQDIRPRDVLAETGAAPFPGSRQATVADQIDQPRFPPVEIALAERLFEPNLMAQPTDRVGVQIEIVAFERRFRREVCEPMYGIDEMIDPRRTIERRPQPRPREVAHFGKRATGISQPIDRAVSGEPRCLPRTSRGEPGAAAKRAADALGRVLQRLLHPAAKCARIQPVGLHVGEHREQRIDARLDRPLAEEFGAKSVDRVDVRFFEMF